MATSYEMSHTGNRIAILCTPFAVSISVSDALGKQTRSSTCRLGATAACLPFLLSRLRHT